MHLPYYQAISKFPMVRRDLAFVVDKEIAATTILTAIQEQMGKRLSDAYLFDVYQGENLGDKLSLAVALYLQDSEKTLQDEEVESSIAMLVAYLKNTFNAPFSACWYCPAVNLIRKIKAAAAKWLNSRLTIP